MTEEEYKHEWENGLHQTDYNLFRFSNNEERIKFARQWLNDNCYSTLNIDNPKTISDKVANYKLYDMSPYKVNMSDKIAVIDTIHNIGLDCILIPTYKKHYGKITEDVLLELKNNKLYLRDIIIKCNHGSGWNLVVNLDTMKDLSYICNVINTWIDLNYAYIAGWEWQYEKITPGYLIQPLLEKNPVDYQFYCEDGNILSVDIQQKISKVIIKHFGYTDINGNPLDYYIGKEPIFKTLPKMFVNAIQKMVPYVKLIAKDKKFIRVDLFYSNCKIYFCEATFSPCSGVLDYSVY